MTFQYFQRAFDIVPKKKLWNRLEEIKVPLKLRDVVERLYENFIANFRNIEDWFEEIHYNIGIAQSYPVSPTLFGI